MSVERCREQEEEEEEEEEEVKALLASSTHCLLTLIYTASQLIHCGLERSEVNISNSPP